MPNAKRTYEKFWLSTTPSRPAVIKQYLIQQGSWNSSTVCPYIANCPVTPVGCCASQ